MIAYAMRRLLSSRFSRKKSIPASQMNKLEEYAVFKKPLDERSEKDIQEMVEILKRYPFFKQSYEANQAKANEKEKSDEILPFVKFLRNIAHHLNIEYAHEGEAIFHKGEVGSIIYFISKGSVGVYVPRDPNEILEDQEAMASIKNKLSLNKKEPPQNFDEIMTEAPGIPEATYRYLKNPKNNNLESYRDMLLLLKKNQHFTPKKFEDWLTFSCGKSSLYLENGAMTFNCIKTLNKHTCFGEMALISSMPRNASIIATEDTFLLSLSESNFKQIFKATISTQLIKNNFFDMIFYGLSKTQIINLQYVFTEKNIERNKVIFKEGDPIDNIYIIRTGQIGIYKKISVENFAFKNLAKKLNYKKTLMLKGKIRLEAADDIIEKEVTKAKKTFFEGNSQISQLQRKNQSHKVNNKQQIGIAEAGGFLGDDDILNKASVRSYTAIALTTPTVIYKLDYHKYLSIKNLYGDIFQGLDNIGKAKLVYKENQLTHFYENAEELDKVIKKGGDVQSQRDKIKRSMQNIEKKYGHKVSQGESDDNEILDGFKSGDLRLDEGDWDEEWKVMIDSIQDKRVIIPVLNKKIKFQNLTKAENEDRSQCGNDPDKHQLFNPKLKDPMKANFQNQLEDENFDNKSSPKKNLAIVMANKKKLKIILKAKGNPHHEVASPRSNPDYIDQKLLQVKNEWQENEIATLKDKKIQLKYMFHLKCQQRDIEYEENMKIQNESQKNKIKKDQTFEHQHKIKYQQKLLNSQKSKHKKLEKGLNFSCNSRIVKNDNNKIQEETGSHFMNDNMIASQHTTKSLGRYGKDDKSNMDFTISAAAINTLPGRNDIKKDKSLMIDLSTHVITSYSAEQRPESAQKNSLSKNKEIRQVSANNQEIGYQNVAEVEIGKNNSKTERQQNEYGLTTKRKSLQNPLKLRFGEFRDFQSTKNATHRPSLLKSNKSVTMSKNKDNLKKVIMGVNHNIENNLSYGLNCIMSKDLKSPTRCMTGNRTEKKSLQYLKCDHTLKSLFNRENRPSIP